MKILILEDDINRIKQFKKNMIGNTLVITNHAVDCINELKKDKFNLVFLDHDLNGKQMEYDEDDCGTVVAKWINKNPLPIDTRVIIHSFNAPAAEYMLKLIPNSIYLPGIWSKKIV